MNMDETAPSENELARFAQWTEIDGDLGGCDPERAAHIREVRLAFATGDALRTEMWRDPDDVDVFADIPYADDGLRAHLLDLYLPHDARLRNGRTTPVFIDIHGGAFVYGYKELNRNFCTHLAERGFAVFSLNYRPVPQTDFLGQLEDVERALSWIKEHAVDYPIDAGNVFITGDSAGGCLALFACLVECDADFARSLGVEAAGLPVKGGVFESGVFAVSDYADGSEGPFAWGDVREITGADFFSVLRRIGPEGLTFDALASRTLPPLFFVTSGDDFVQSETLGFAAALAKAHRPFELHDWPIGKAQSLGHVFPVCMTWLDESRTTLGQIRDFAYRQL